MLAIQGAQDIGPDEQIRSVLTGTDRR